MLFPGSRVWYEGTAADLASLTEELKGTAFSGHIVLEFQDSLDLVVCVGGEFLKVIEKIGRRLLSTKKYREIWGKCQIKQGRMLVFELPPQLARRLRAMRGRRLLRSGSAAAGCDPAALLRELRTQRFSGFLDCVSPAGKLLLDYEAGVIVACHHTEYAGIARDGLGAFRAWHEAYVGAAHASFFFLSEKSADGDGPAWDDLLMDGAEQVALPLASSLERLERAYGRAWEPGALVAEAGSPGPGVIVLLAGGLEVLRPGAPGAAALLGAGAIAGLDWLAAAEPAVASLRAREASRGLLIGREELATAIANSPPLGARLAREAARLLLARREQLAFSREDPRLRDVSLAVAETIERRPGSDGEIAATELFRELTQQLPLSLPQIDELLRRLAGAGAVRQAEGRVALVTLDL